MQNIIPNLWFDGNAAEAATYYLSIFKDGKMISTTYYPKTEAEGLADFQKDFAGKVLTVEFEILGMRFIGINAGPLFKFTEAISLFVDCNTQAEVDELWEKLSAGGEKGQCGWLKDKYGLSWQIIPRALGELMGDKDPLKSQRVMQAMLKMTKIDVEGLIKAYENK